MRISNALLRSMTTVKMSPKYHWLGHLSTWPLAQLLTT